MKPLFWTSRIIPVTSQDLALVLTSTLTSLWTTLSSRNPQSPQNASEILRYKYEVVRQSAQAEANVQSPSQLQVE